MNMFQIFGLKFILGMEGKLLRDNEATYIVVLFEQTSLFKLTQVHSGFERHSHHKGILIIDQLSNLQLHHVSSDVCDVRIVV